MPPKWRRPTTRRASFLLLRLLSAWWKFHPSEKKRKITNRRDESRVWLLFNSGRFGRRTSRSFFSSSSFFLFRKGFSWDFDNSWTWRRAVMSVGASHPQAKKESKIIVLKKKKQHEIECTSKEAHAPDSKGFFFFSFFFFGPNFFLLPIPPGPIVKCCALWV